MNNLGLSMGLTKWGPTHMNNLGLSKWGPTLHEQQPTHMGLNGCLNLGLTKWVPAHVNNLGLTKWGPTHMNNVGLTKWGLSTWGPNTHEQPWDCLNGDQHSNMNKLNNLGLSK